MLVPLERQDSMRLFHLVILFLLVALPFAVALAGEAVPPPLAGEPRSFPD